MKTTGNFIDITVSIIPEAEIFSIIGTPKIGIDLNASSNYSLYNGTLNLTEFYIGGFNPDNVSDRRTIYPFIRSYGSTNVDVTVKASNILDKDNLNNIIYINSTNGNLQGYIQNVGWINIPNLNEGKELCIVNNMSITNDINYYDLRIKSKDVKNGKYISSIYLATYDTEKYNICNSAGKYVIP